MNLYLHGIDADPCPIKSGVDSLASDPGQRFSVVMTNPPFGKKSTIAVVNEAGDLEKHYGFTPKGLHHIAQGCREAATLGIDTLQRPTLKALCRLPFGGYPTPLRGVMQPLRGRGWVTP